MSAIASNAWSRLRQSDLAWNWAHTPSAVALGV